MDIECRIYQCWRDGMLDYSFSCDGYEGTIGKVLYLQKGGMVFSFNIDPEFHGYGIGQTAFNQAYEELSKRYHIKYIEATWLRNREFPNVESESRLNFNLYKNGKKNGLSYHQAALATSTGKWASELGYNKVALIKDTSRTVEVLFYRNIFEGDMDISFDIESYLLS